MLSLWILPFLSVYTEQTQAARIVNVDTTSGPVTGFTDDVTPGVAQFLNIPYAEPPSGPRRWLPPRPKSRTSGINATAFGNSCPQFPGNKTTVWSADAPQFGTPATPMGEDCLSVSIWAPEKSLQGEELVPVVAWLYGGSFQSGGSNVPYQNPSKWVARSQGHIVVAINYRLNIFGFPNAAGLPSDEQNVGLLDQRLGLEWIRTNIENFGGDPDLITLYGESAGAVGVDLYNYAYPDDPIVSGLIMASGTALAPSASYDPSHTNFTFVANHFGCGHSGPQAEVDCLRKISSTSIISFLEEYSNSDASPALGFLPIFDERTRFANFTARALAGNFTRRPAIIGTTINEGNAFVLPYDRKNGPNSLVADWYTLNIFLCPAVKTTQDRYAARAPTFRYLYGGNFSNISPQWWEGAFHASELPLVFGTTYLAKGPSTPFQTEVAERIQDLWLAFARDPVGGLPQRGWNAYTPQGNAVLLGKDGKVVQPIAETRFASVCDGAAGKPGQRPPP